MKKNGMKLGTIIPTALLIALIVAELNGVPLPWHLLSGPVGYLGYFLLMAAIFFMVWQFQRNDPYNRFPTTYFSLLMFYNVMALGFRVECLVLSVLPHIVHVVVWLRQVRAAGIQEKAGIHYLEEMSVRGMMGGIIMGPVVDLSLAVLIYQYF